MIWKKTTTLEELNRLCQDSAVGYLGIEFCAQGERYLEARVAVNSQTIQPFGLLHGGVSALLAETVASAAGLLCVENHLVVVGTELNISHLKPISQGYATARATPLHLGNSSHVWQVEQFNEQQQLCAMSRVSLKLLENKR